MMATHKKTLRRTKYVDPEVLRKRVEKAVITLRKAIMTAMRQNVIPMDLSSSLNQQLCTFDSEIMEALPQANKKPSEARLPFD